MGDNKTNKQVVTLQVITIVLLIINIALKFI